MPIKLQGREFATYEELVQEATRMSRVADGTLNDAIEILEHDREAKFCLVKARVWGPCGSFEALGDASPANVARNILPHYIRMAGTRAKARCLRQYTGRGVTCAEELDTFTGDEQSTVIATAKQPAKQPAVTLRIGHHPSWEKDRPGFCAWCNREGTNYDDLARWCEAEGWKRPSSWSRNERRRLMNDVDEWLEKHLIWLEKVAS